MWGGAPAASRLPRHAARGGARDVHGGRVAAVDVVPLDERAAVVADRDTDAGVGVDLVVLEGEANLLRLEVRASATGNSTS